MQIPSDWPQDEALDLMVHDLPHASSDTEWWYFNCHLSGSNTQEYSLFACFFMHRLPGQTEMAYSAIWSLTDCQSKQCLAYSLVDQNTPNIALQQLRQDKNTDIGFKLALQDILQQKQLPSDDRLMSTISISETSLGLQFDQLGLNKIKNGDYELVLDNPRHDIQIKLTFKPEKPVCHHGDKGIIPGPKQESMYYYFIPRCSVQGSIRYSTDTSITVHGQGWYDHEFGRYSQTEHPSSFNSWTWISIQLDNGFDLSVYQLYPLGVRDNAKLYCTVIDPNGNQQFYPSAQMRANRQWKSLLTYSDYDCQWIIDIAEMEISLSISAFINNQEFPTLIAYPAFWEGRCDVEGTFMGQSVQGLSYVEQLLAEPVGNMSELFHSVSQQVDHEITQLMPLDGEKSSYIDLFASSDNRHYLDDVDCQLLNDTIIAPIRSITDRQGKRWRSYVLSACCHLVGGQFDSYTSWLAVPELIHTGSLIIDDIQDKSDIRRGGPACHKLYGESLAMNAGTLAYGLFESVLRQSNLSTEAKCEIYQLFFGTYRAAHVGQAIDLVGFLPQFTQSIDSGNGDQLERQILAAHRLKSAVPASLLAKMGVVLGKGARQQANIIGRYFEMVGVAFQIIDDVLNLRGFDNQHKQTAEDILAGKITYPMAKAVSYLKKEELYWIAEVLQSQTDDYKSHSLIIERLESSGVLEACCQKAQTLIDNAWQLLDSAFPQTHTKTMFRVFGHYVIHRTT